MFNFAECLPIEQILGLFDVSMSAMAVELWKILLAISLSYLHYDALRDCVVMWNRDDDRLVSTLSNQALRSEWLWVWVMSIRMWHLHAKVEPSLSVRGRLHSQIHSRIHIHVRDQGKHLSLLQPPSCRSLSACDRKLRNHSKEFFIGKFDCFLHVPTISFVQTETCFKMLDKYSRMLARYFIPLICTIYWISFCEIFC